MPAARKKSAFDFGAAPVVEAAPKASKSSLPSFQIAGVEDYATMRQFEAVAKAGRLAIESDLKEAGTIKFVELGVSQGKRPENFVGTEGADSKATFVFRRRDSRSILTDDQIDLFTAQFGDEWVETNIHTDDTPDTFSFNSEYMSNPEWREKLQEALGKIPNLPADIIVRTPGKSVRTVKDETIDGIFSGRDAKVAAAFLPLVTSLGIKVAKSVTVDLAGLLVKVAAIIKQPHLAEAMATATTNPDSVLSEEYGKKPSSKRK